MNILAIGTSNSAHSINRALAAYAAKMLDAGNVEVLNIHDYEMPLFSVEREQELGSPPKAQAFYRKIADADVMVIAFAEHNGSYSAAWKNLFDWTSRIDTKVFQNKPSVFLSTSPGPGGAANVLAAAVKSATHFGADLVASYSIPSFHKNFDSEKLELLNVEVKLELEMAMEKLQQKFQA